jgi:hypothetical protein
MITFPQIVIDGETLRGFQELLAASRPVACPNRSASEP